MKINKIIASVLTVLLLLSISMFSASAAPSSEVVYENDFSSGELDDTFKITYGNLAVVEEKGDKLLRVTKDSADRVHFAYGPEEQRNYDLSFKVRATFLTNSTNTQLTAFFRSPHIPAWDTVSYHLQFRTYQTALMYADRFADENTLTSLSDYPDFGISSGLWNNVQISTRGDRMIIYVNGNLFFEYTDSQYGELGGFGFTARGVSFDVDDVVITRYYGSSMPEPTANERPQWAGDISEDEEADIEDTGLPRLDFTTLGQEKVVKSNAIHFLNPFELTVYTWIALAVAAVSAVAAVTGWLIIVKRKRSENLQ